MASSRVQTLQEKQTVAAAPVHVTPEEDARLILVGHELLARGVQVEDWVELKRLAREELYAGG